MFLQSSIAKDSISLTPSSIISLVRSLHSENAYVSTVSTVPGIINSIGSWVTTSVYALGLIFFILLGIAGSSSRSYSP